MSKIKQLYKIVILGQAEVGKTSIIYKYAKNQFYQQLPRTVNCNFLSKQFHLSNGKVIQLAIWDTAGQERFHAVTPIYYRDALATIIVYDITNHQSFIKMKKWVQQIKEYGNKNCKIVLCGNKSDRESLRKIKKDQIKNYAQINNLDEYQVSAKLGTGLKQMFRNIAQTISKNPKQKGRGGLIIDEQNKKKVIKKDKCC